MMMMTMLMIIMQGRCSAANYKLLRNFKFSAAKKVEQLEASHDGDDINDNEDDNNDNAKKKVEHLDAKKVDQSNKEAKKVEKPQSLVIFTAIKV